MSMLQVAGASSLHCVWEGLEVWWDGLLTRGPSSFGLRSLWKRNSSRGHSGSQVTSGKGTRYVKLGLAMTPETFLESKRAEPRVGTRTPASLGQVPGRMVPCKWKVEDLFYQAV